MNRGQRSGASTATRGAASRPAAPDVGGRGSGMRSGLSNRTRDLAGDAEVAQAVGPVARDLEVDREVAADVRGRLVVQARQGEPLGQGLHRHVEPDVVGEPVPADDHRCSGGGLGGLVAVTSSPGR